MNSRAIFVTEPDLGRLRALLRGMSESSIRDQEHLQDLRGELDRATAVDPDEVPEGVVTMHSQVRVEDVDTGETRMYTLVFPHEADVASGRISVLAPLGTALLGYREGDEVEWEMPGGVRRLRIREVQRAPLQSGTRPPASGADESGYSGSGDPPVPT